MKNFDTFIGIDWSGAKEPVFTKSIAVALCEQGQGTSVPISNPYGQKFWSRTCVFQWIKTLINENKRILIGIDANFGYAQEIGLKKFNKLYNYNNLWYEINLKSQDKNNFFAQDFWEAYPEYFWTTGKKPEHISLPKRKTEIVCGRSGYGYPESPFKLIGPKQVGKGGLAAMRMAYALKQDCGDKIAIWPFEREICDQACIVMTEIYPRQFLMRTSHGVAKVRTLEELNKALVSLDSKEMLGQHTAFSDHEADALVSAAGLRHLCGSQPHIPQKIANPPDMADDEASREGWIFGVGDKATKAKSRQ